MRQNEREIPRISQSGSRQTGRHGRNRKVKHTKEKGKRP